MRGKQALRVVALVIIILLASRAESDAQVRVGYRSGSQAELALLTELKRAYESAVPGAQVELVPLDSTHPQQLLEWLVTGSKADVFLLPVQTIAALKRTGALMTLAGSRWHGLEQALYNFPPGMRQAYSEERGPVGVPVTADVALFQYNESMMQNAGLPPLSRLGETWTWHDMIEVGRRVSVPEQRRYLVDIDFEFVAVYFLAHGDVIDPEGKPDLLNQFNAQFLDLASRAINEERISPPLTQQSDSSGRFRRGVLGMRRRNISQMLPGTLDRDGLQLAFEWDVVPLPLSPYTYRRPAFGEGSGLVVGQGAVVTPDLVGFLEMAASVEGQQAVARSGYAFPASPLLWEAAMLYAPGPPNNRAAFAQAIQEWTFFAFPQVSDAEVNRLVASLGAILSGNVDPEQGLRMIQITLDEIYRED